MKLCIDVRMAFFSGIGTFIRNIVPFLNRPPFEVTLLVSEEGQEWCKDFEQIVMPIGIYSMAEQFAFPWKVPCCDLFWSPHYNIPLLPIRVKKRIVTIHDACHLVWHKGLERLYAKFMMGRAFWNSDVVVTDSEFSKRELRKYLGDRDVQVIPLAVDQKKFQRAAREEIRQKYWLPSRFFLYVGNIKPHKNLTGLLQAMKEMAGWELVIVGKGALSIPDEDLPAVYSLADCLIFPSFYEGFGLPPLEAMSCGCPTLVSNGASIPEVCGDASGYFRPDRPEEMVAMMKKVVEDQEFREGLIQKGTERAKSFSWEKTGQLYRELFLESF